MLVLSRRETDLIRFPELGITIEFLKIKGNLVRVGVDAPIEIKVLRGELETADQQKLTKKILITDEDEHAVRNKLNSLSIAVAVAEKHLSSQRTQQAANVLARAIARLEKVDDVSAGRGETIEFSDGEKKPDCVRALLVEDVENERTMLTGFLRLHGIEVDAVDDGVKALEYLDANAKPDFILMDMGLPQLDGASTIRSIRKSPAFDPVEIFAISGDTAESVGIDTGKNRISHWFQKPLEPKALVERIRVASDQLKTDG
jgi:carbon storage regulator CsrA